MATNITLLNYNNYFNRIVKSESTLAAYKALDSNYTDIAGVNFNPADGVNTDLVVGTSSIPHNYDYLIVWDTSDSSITSRWFIMDEDRTRNGQYHLTLRRDVIIDHYDDIKNAPTFIEKGIISDTTDPLLYNSESMTYNQIKQSETLLKDSTGCGWVVGYIPQNAFSSPKSINKNVVLASHADYELDISTWDYYPACSLSSAGEIWAASALSKQLILKSKVHYPAASTQYYTWPEHKVKGLVYVPQGGTVTGAIDTSATSYEDWSPVYSNRNTGAPNFPTTYEGTYVATNMPGDSTLWTYAGSVLADQGIGGSIVVKDATTINNMIALNGKTIKDTSSNSYYKINLRNVTAAGSTELDSSLSSVSTLVSRINSDKVASYEYGGVRLTTYGDFTADQVQIGYNGNGYRLELTQIFTFASVEIDNNRNHVLDAPYDIFCIPYSDTKRLQIDSSTTVDCSKDLAIGIAQEIAKDAGTGSIYDTQLLPYCPSIEVINKNPNMYADNATIDLQGLSIDIVRDATNSYVEDTSIHDQASFTQAQTNHGQIYDEDYREIFYYSASNAHYYYRSGSQGDPIGAIIWCASATRTFDINEPITVSNNAIDRKVERECDTYRLCSGNYQGVFEFNAAMSWGVSGFRVDCTFKPYNPYIHVVPKLGGLYGEGFADFKDSRGLICGGDFSLAQLSDAWANYELQNKNYNAIFDRQIQNMEVTQKYNQIEGLVSAAAGSVTGAMSGASAGVMAGNPAAAIGMGIAGGVASLGAGIADVAIGYERYKEAKSYAIDMYGYQLGNIKAIPTSLSKNTALTANTKIFPFIEKYSCTDTEKTALENKITYNGMTIMKIGTPNSFVGTGFFKGQIIRLPSLKEDNHMANAIYEEINKGVYL